MSVFITLALIPFAVIGACILFVAVRKLMPYATLLFGAAVLFVAQQDGVAPDMRSVGSAIGSCVALAGLAWAIDRWVGGSARRRA